jgi:hypothetical protein
MGFFLSVNSESGDSFFEKCRYAPDLVMNGFRTVQEKLISSKPTSTISWPLLNMGSIGYDLAAAPWPF